MRAVLTGGGLIHSHAAGCSEVSRSTALETTASGSLPLLAPRRQSVGVAYGEEDSARAGSVIVSDVTVVIHYS